MPTSGGKDDPSRKNILKKMAYTSGKRTMNLLTGVLNLSFQNILKWGFIIAFTSDFIPRLVYMLTVSDDNSLTGFMNSSLAIMDTRDLDLTHTPLSSVDYCRYSDFREPPWSSNKYERTPLYWRVLTARLTFVVVFENIVVMVVLFVGWCIPDIPGHLKEQIRREVFITNEIIIHQEAMRARGYRVSEGTDSSSPESKETGDYIHLRKPKKKEWHKDFSVRPQDEALVHRPSDYGEINEVTV